MLDNGQLLSRFYMLQPSMFDFHCKDGTCVRHIFGFVYFPFLYMGVRDLVCRIDLWHRLSPPFISQLHSLHV
jgi:hypothetical protein